MSTRATEEYYERLQARMGPAEVDKFARYYEVPGYGHAVSSTFNAAWDSLTALENWVERDTEPSAQVVTDTAGVPGRTRPLCDFPEWAQYNGTGDLNLAASFTCVEHETVLPTQRQTHLGPILGNDYSATSGTYAWKGIPFAKAPVGDLRWKPPAEPAAWTTARTAQQFGNACVSFGRLYGPGLNNKYDATIGTTLGQPVGSEDCLYLNIWRPAGAADQSAGDRVRLRRQQRHRLHRRPGVRRSQPREDRQRGGRHGELPPEPVRLLQPRAAEDRRAARTTRATSRCST